MVSIYARTSLKWGITAQRILRVLGGSRRVRVTCDGILRMMTVGWVADSGQRYGGHAYNDALAAARLRGVHVVVPACHQRWVDDEVTFTFLAPCGLPFTDGANDVNENSLVVLVQYRTLRALFMGDAGFQSEQRLLDQGIDLHADILKVGHHGSAYSSSTPFIEAVHPHVAIVSVGRHNLFGHPAPLTLETLRLVGASVYRTDQCGAVRIATAGSGALSIETMLSCAWAPYPHRGAKRHVSSERPKRDP
jgi:beta-lactamase superfamily II metal-dependent hydrolase